MDAKESSPILDFVHAIQRDLETLKNLPSDFDGDGLVPPTTEWNEGRVAIYAMKAFERLAGLRYDAIRWIADKGQLPTFEPMLWSLWEAYRYFRNAAVDAPLGEFDHDTKSHHSRYALLLAQYNAVYKAIDRLWFALPAVASNISRTESPPAPPASTITYMRLILDTERRTVSHADRDTHAIPLTDPVDVAVLAKLFEFGDRYCHRDVLSEAIYSVRESDDPKAVEKRISHVRSVVEPLGYEITNDRKGHWRIAIQSDTARIVSSNSKHPKRATGKNKATRMKVAGKKSGS